MSKPGRKRKSVWGPRPRKIGGIKRHKGLREGVVRGFLGAWGIFGYNLGSERIQDAILVCISMYWKVLHSMY